jgi:hypothetical protein
MVWIALAQNGASLPYVNHFMACTGGTLAQNSSSSHVIFEAVQ